MPDREKVIKEFEAFVNGNCPSDSKHVCHIELMETVLDLLKEQEAVKVQYTAMGGLRYGACPQCDARIDNLVNPKACGFCGQAVKWE